MKPAHLAATLLLLPTLSPAQSSTQRRTFAIEGHQTTIPLTTINGRYYVDIEALARLTSGSLRYAGAAALLDLPASAATPSTAAAQPPKPQFSQPFLRAAIEQMTEIREWRIAIVSAVQNNQPVSEAWVSGYRRAAETKLTMAGAAATTPPDRSAFQLLENEFNNMQQLSSQFTTLNATHTFTPTTAFDGNPLDIKVLTCARALASMAASGQFQDEPSCH